MIKVINQACNKSPSRGIHCKLSQLPRRIAQTYVYICIVSSFWRLKPCGSYSVTPRLCDVGTYIKNVDTKFTHKIVALALAALCRHRIYFWHLKWGKLFLLASHLFIVLGIDFFPRGLVMLSP